MGWTPLRAVARPAADVRARRCCKSVRRSGTDDVPENVYGQVSNHRLRRGPEVLAKRVHCWTSWRLPSLPAGVLKSWHALVQTIPPATSTSSPTRTRGGWLVGPRSDQAEPSLVRHGQRRRARRTARGGGQRPAAHPPPRPLRAGADDHAPAPTGARRKRTGARSRRDRTGDRRSGRRHRPAARLRRRRAAAARRAAQRGGLARQRLDRGPLAGADRGRRHHPRAADARDVRQREVVRRVARASIPPVGQKRMLRRTGRRTPSASRRRRPTSAGNSFACVMPRSISATHVRRRRRARAGTARRWPAGASSSVGVAPGETRKRAPAASASATCAAVVTVPGADHGARRPRRRSARSPPAPAGVRSVTSIAGSPPRTSARGQRHGVLERRR